MDDTTRDDTAPASAGNGGEGREIAAIEAEAPGREAETATRPKGGGGLMPLVVLMGVVASLAITFLVFRNRIVDFASSQTNLFSADFSAQMVEDGHTDAMVTETAEVGMIGETKGAEEFSAGTGAGHDAPTLDEGDAFVLTAGEWNDNDNWPFFMNLVGGDVISFPVFGLNPSHRVKVTLTDASGAATRGKEVVLRDATGAELWRTRSDKNGVAVLFWRDDQAPARVEAGDTSQAVTITGADAQEGGTGDAADIRLTVGGGGSPATLQVMFIVDTTGSMGDELAYLQKDFASIASEVGGEGVTYATSFYRDEGDEYVTRVGTFTDDVAATRAQLAGERAIGGGDTPEAVAQILDEAITNNGAWRDDAAKVAFLVFDAPPHDGTDAELDAACRSAAARGIRIVPVVASNAERETELFGRALAILTNGTYVFLTDDSGVGDSHLTPIVGDYTVELLHDVIVRIINDSR